MSEIVRLEGVTKSFKRGSEEIHAVDKIDLSLGAGEYVSVVGPSGSGKTTLLNMIGCIDRPSEGSVAVGGIETTLLKDSELARVRASTFGFVFQQFFLMPTLTALENVMVPGRFAVEKNSDLLGRARDLLELVGMSERETHYPVELSGGEMQRVAIARALINRPTVLLADEPTGNLDSRMSRELTELFDRLNDDGLTIVVVTHNDELAKSCNRKIHIKDGKIVDDQRTVSPAKARERVEVAPSKVIVTEVTETGSDLFLDESPEEAEKPGGYLPTRSTPHRIGVIELGIAAAAAGLLALASTFMPWVPGASGYAFLEMVNYPGASYGGNIFVRTYTGSGAVLLTGIWAILAGTVILMSGIAIALKRRRAFVVAAIAGAAGFIVAIFNIVMVFTRMGSAGSGAGVGPGVGLWVLAVASLAAAVVGIWGALKANAPVVGPAGSNEGRSGNHAKSPEGEADE